MSLSLLRLVSAALVFATSVSAQELEYKRAPGVLGPRAPRVGEWIPDLAVTLASGGGSTLSSVMGERGLVVLMRDTDCPLSKRYSPKVARLEGELKELGFGVLYVGVDAEEVSRDVEAHGFGAPYAVDPDQVVARALEAKTTTEAFVLDRTRTLVYRGMIDDQYGLGFAKPAPSREYLREAVQALASGARVGTAATVAQGCLLALAESEVSARGEVTYHNRISRIVQDHCQVCHRPGQAGPFPLTNYAEVVRRKGMIKWAVDDGVMPPWFASHESGPWANDRGLTESEKADVLAWIAAGAPEGEAANAPLERTWTPGWTIGEPDLVVELTEPVRVPAEGVVEYQYAYVKTELPEDRWVKAIEIRPGAPEVVHHVLVFVEDPEVRAAARRGDSEAQRIMQRGFETFYAGTVPGQLGVTYPEGFGKFLPAGSWLKFQLHYTPNGTEQLDRTEVGFVFADEPLAEVHTDSAHNRDFSIPPGAFDFEVRGEFEFEEDAAILSLLPHGHLRSNRFLCELVSPTGEVEPLLSLPFYDFNWQLNYDLLEPRIVPAGTRLRATAWYDNSPENPANPDPTAWVEFGDQTTDEMMINYVTWVPAEKLTAD